MYVCICNAVTENEVRQAAREGARTLSDLQHGLGVATGCGQCAKDACSLLNGGDEHGTSIRSTPYPSPSGSAV